MQKNTLLSYESWSVSCSFFAIRCHDVGPHQLPVDLVISTEDSGFFVAL